MEDYSTIERVVIKGKLKELFHAQKDDRGVLMSRLPSAKHRYLYKEMIGRGGMKEIHKVYDPLIGRHVALAELHAKGHEEAFLREAHLTARLDHPGIINIFEIGCHESPYFTMELLSGQSLEQLIETLTLEELLQIYLKVCDAVSYAHSKKVLHLDLKPDNIYIAPFGKVVVCDWGLGKMTGDDASDSDLNGDTLNHITLMGQVKGTPGWMAPEQASGRGHKDERTDVYALGALLYMMICKKPPVEGDSIEEVLEKTLKGSIKTPKQYPALVSVAMKALNLDPIDRYQKVENLNHEVRRFLNGHPTLAENANIFKQLSLVYKRNKRECQIILVAILIVLVSSISYFVLQEKNLQKTEQALLYAEEMKDEAVQNLDLFKRQTEITNKVVQDNFDLHFNLIKQYRYHLFFVNPEKITNDAKKMLWTSYKEHSESDKLLRAIMDVQMVRQEYDQVRETSTLLKREQTQKIKIFLSYIDQLPSLSDQPSIGSLIKLLKSFENQIFPGNYIAEQIVVYDDLLRRDRRGYPPLIEQLVRNWNRNVDFDFFYDKKKFRLKIVGKELYKLRSDQRDGSGECLLRFLKIKKLDISNTKINELREIEDLIYLEELNIAGAPIKNLNYIRRFPTLKKLTLTDGQFSKQYLKQKIPKSISLTLVKPKH